MMADPREFLLRPPRCARAATNGAERSGERRVGGARLASVVKPATRASRHEKFRLPARPTPLPSFRGGRKLNELPPHSRGLTEGLPEGTSALPFAVKGPRRAAHGFYRKIRDDPPRRNLHRACNAGRHAALKFSAQRLGEGEG